MAAKGSLYPPDPRQHILRAGWGCLPFPGTPRPPLWGRVYGGIKVELAPGAVGGEWDWLGGFGVGPGAPCLTSYQWNADWSSPRALGRFYLTGK